MNYGIGGSITGHLDSVGEVRGDGDDAAAAKAGGTKKSESEGQEKGGERLVNYIVCSTIDKMENSIPLLCMSPGDLHDLPD